MKKTSSLNVITIFILSYSFFIVQILSQVLFNMFNKMALLYIIGLQILFPLFIYYISKIINKKELKETNNFNYAFSLISCIYLIVTTILYLSYMTNIVSLYYYPQVSLVIILLITSIPLIYTIYKGHTSLFYLSIIFLLIFTSFKYAYLFNPISFDTYPLYGLFKQEKGMIFKQILFSLPILLEPILLINNKRMMNSKINLKYVLFISISISIISIITATRQVIEYGALIQDIRFPYLESIKNITSGKFFENIDFYYLLSIAICLYIRLGYTLSTIKTSFNLNRLFTFAVLAFILAISYFVQKSMNLYLFSIDKILFISSLCLILCILLLPFTIKRRSANV